MYRAELTGNCPILSESRARNDAMVSRRLPRVFCLAASDIGAAEAVWSEATYGLGGEAGHAPSRLWKGWTMSPHRSCPSGLEQSDIWTRWRGQPRAEPPVEGLESIATSELPKRFGAKRQLRQGGEADLRAKPPASRLESVSTSELLKRFGAKRQNQRLWPAVSNTTRRASH
jgi:hypothetical protein